MSVFGCLLKRWIKDWGAHITSSHNPAPLDLCFFPGFDLKENVRFCPVERNALKMFYDSAKGNEWTNSTHWIDPYISHCLWYGVNCNDSNSTTKLELQNNGLSGVLSSSIANLSLIEYLNLADNDIMVCIILSCFHYLTLQPGSHLYFCDVYFIGIDTIRSVTGSFGFFHQHELLT